MPASAIQAPKAQPWKANWPPARQEYSDKSFGFAKGETMILDGGAGSGGPRKAQPWKANWPPARQEYSDKSFGFAKGETMILDGGAGSGGPRVVKDEEKKS